MEQGQVFERGLLTSRSGKAGLRAVLCNGASSEHDILQISGLYHMGGLGLRPWVVNRGGHSERLKNKRRDPRLRPECEQAGKDLGARILDDHG